MKFTKSHEWVKYENNVAIIGVTNHAQNELSDVVFIELPKVGDKVNKGEVMLSIESVKAASDVYAPISGEIVEINENLDQSPEKINSSPEDEGWLVKIKIDNMTELDELLEQSDYQSLISSS